MTLLIETVDPSGCQKFAPIYAGCHFRVSEKRGKTRIMVDLVV